MKQQEFLTILNKYKKNECSHKEKELLYTYCEKAQHKTINNIWKDQKKSEVKYKILQKIDQDIKPLKIPKKTVSIKLVGIVAVMVFAVSTLYHKLSINNNPNINQKYITLELASGEIQIIKKSKTGILQIFNQNGKVISKQEKSFFTPQNINSNNSKTANNKLHIPYGKTLDLQLPDGTKAYLNSGSSISYPTSFKHTNRREISVTGEVFLKVTKNPNKPFILNNSEMNITVLGTQFNVHAYPEDKTTEVVLVEGSIKLKTKNDSVILKPNEKASINKKNHQIVTQNVIANIYTSWVEGDLVFRNMSFKNILKKLERRYDVIIINKNKKLSDDNFNARFDKTDLDLILKSFEEHYNIKYTKNNKTITIY